jgi:molecular chaperone HscB
VAAESQSASEEGGASIKPELEAFDATLDHFARFGLARRWQLDRDALEDRYLEASRRVHPDRHANADAATRRAALEHSAAINEAYRVLRDGVRRAEYLVKLGGIDLDSSDPKTGAPHPEQSFLIEMIERREQLEDSTDEDALDELRDEVESELEGTLDRAIAALQFDHGSDHGSDQGRGDVRAAAAALVHRRYLQRFLTEIDAART